MSQITRRTLDTNGIRMHVAEQGAGPLVLLCHGFPESWYSWRHQLPALAAAGYHAIAHDMRGYGGTDQPEAIDQYTQLHHVGDMVGLLDALGADTAVIVGHDWGAPVAWNAALLRPDRFRAVAGLSVPYTPRGGTRPTVALARAYGETFMYMLYFQTPGVAEAELGRDVEHGAVRAVRHLGRWRGHARPAEALDVPREHARTRTLPAWPAKPTSTSCGEFARTGFRGGLNRYRNLDRTWELMAAWRGARITVPALFVAGDRDPVILRSRAAMDGLAETVPGLRERVLLPGAGHWTQQERPAEVNDALITFLAGLPRE